MCAFVVLVFFQYHVKWLAGKNVSEMTCFERDVKPSASQLIAFYSCVAVSKEQRYPETC